MPSRPVASRPASRNEPANTPARQRPAYPGQVCLNLLVLALLVPLLLASTPAFAKKAQAQAKAHVKTHAKSRAKANNITPTPEMSEKQADLGELRDRIKDLRKDLNSSEESKADAAERLRTSEKQISRLQRELSALADQREQIEQKQKNLELQSQELGDTLIQQQSQLERLLYKQYLRGTPDSLQLLLNGNDPNQMARDLHYMSAIALARTELMGEINSTLERKKALAKLAKEHANELQTVAEQQQQRHTELQKQREERQQLYAEISDKVKAQRKEIGNLQQNEKRLTQLIDGLAKKLAEQAAQAEREAKAARAAEAARIAEAARQKSHPNKANKEAPRPAQDVEPSHAKTTVAENHYEPVASDGSFARQKGRLRLPVRGAVAGRFGSPRDGGGTWRGLFIKAASGGEVKAIANGRVVFADWMRGFGNLLIIDHGDAYLSIYGNNDSLLKQLGQIVKGGETVATVGNSGGNPDSGLYFELRHKGQPIDPMKWASLK